jgi:hypothetical protein
MHEQDHWDEICHLFSGGDGSSPAAAIQIHMECVPPDFRDMMGIRLEYTWINRYYPGSQVLEQQMVEQNGLFDMIRLKLPSGETKELYFEISTLFSKEPQEPLPNGDSEETQQARQLKLALLIGAAVVGLIAGFYRSDNRAHSEPSQTPMERLLQEERARQAEPFGSEALAARTAKTMDFRGTPEQTHTLADFYPDAVARQRAHHLFAKNFLPRHLRQDPESFFADYYLDPALLLGDKALQPAPDPVRMIQVRWAFMEIEAGLVPRPQYVYGGPTVFRRVSDLRMVFRQIANHPIALVQMPLPEQPGQAYFVGAMLMARMDKPQAWCYSEVRYFTLDATTNGLTGTPATGVLREWLRPGVPHFQSVVIPVQEEAFLQALKQRVENSGQPSSGMSTPVDDRWNTFAHLGFNQ